MVGVPRSTGCALCIKRRIKCDEGRPSCANCTKYGQGCPGYDKSLKFVVGKVHRSRRQQRSYLKHQKTTGADSPIVWDSPIFISESPSPLISRSVPSLPSLPSPVDVKKSFVEPDHVLSGPYGPEEWIYTYSDLIKDSSAPFSFADLPHESVVQPYDKPMDPFMCLSINSPAFYQAQSLSILADHLPKWTGSGDLLFMARWVSFLPSRFGRNQALDAAITCFTVQQLGTTQGNQRMLAYARSTYIQALNLLQKSINNLDEASSSETLCAAILLCIYELFAGTTAFNSWMKHAAGIARLMIFRGPERHRNEFDHSMLIAFRGVITMECMFNGKPCFLAEDAWRLVARENRSSCVPDHLFNMFEDFSMYMAMMPEVLRDGWKVLELRKTNSSPCLDSKKGASLIGHSLDLYDKFRAWGKRFTRLVPSAYEAPSPRKDPLFPVVFKYDHPGLATIYCTYWACLILLQEILKACHFFHENAVDDQDLVENICKSVESNGSGVWGPFRMAFPLRIAWECATPEVRTWIGTWHELYSQHYAATSMESLPDGGRPRIAKKRNKAEAYLAMEKLPPGMRSIREEVCG